MSNSSSGSLSRLLRRSKVLHLPHEQPVVTSTYGGYRHRKDFGLKRPMPSISARTPYARVKSVDSPAGMTDFINSGKQSLFVKKWDEGGWGVQTHTYSGQEDTLVESWWDKESRRPPVRSEQPNSSRRLETDYLSMPEDEFSRHLALVRKLRPQFRAYLQKRARDSAAKAAGYESYAQYEAAAPPKPGLIIPEVDLYAAAQSLNEASIREFLDAHASEVAVARSETTVEPMEHVNLSLSYAATSRFHNDRFSPPIPARLLARSEFHRAGSYAQTEYTASAVGAIVQVPAHRSGGLSPTQWTPDREGFINREQGKGLFRIERAEVRTTTTVSSDATRMSRWSFESHIAELNNDRPDMLPQPPLSISLRHIDSEEEARWTTPGSPRWVVGNPEETEAQQSATKRRDRLAEQTEDMFSSSLLTVGPRDDLKPVGLRPPRLSRAENPENQKARANRQENARRWRVRPSFNARAESEKFAEHLNGVARDQVPTGLAGDLGKLAASINRPQEKPVEKEGETEGPQGPADRGSS
jgi:hypothetical protein